jgi:phthiocerol/phenolphthiocerol synthesis type-I polyketide synthase E
MSSNSHKAARATDIAIIAANGRFPGAANLEEFWQNLSAGRESISAIEFSDRDSHSNHASNKSTYWGGRLDGADMFDAGFFGFNPREAAVTDPQHRILLECAWETMEMAGYDGDSFPGSVGVFVGASPGWYGYKLFSDPELISQIGGTQFMIGNTHHFLATRISYKLNLKGPSVVVQTACSTSLATVHMACQSLISGECDMALAGGVGFPLQSVELGEVGEDTPDDSGIMAQDGHCRAFDAAAQGTVTGDGAGLVLLKRLENALEDGDYIHAVIKGSAINNDGSTGKAGYTAPSVDGQAKVIAEALAVADVSPETVTYMEAHGTGTLVGDPIEILSLTRAFQDTDRKSFCAIGSAKTNIGHLDAAAGITGLIKSVLALQHKMIPASLNFENPNPLIDFDNSPFYVNSELSEWPSKGALRRAGVNAFGFGGTNVHVIVEEAESGDASGIGRAGQIWTLSARTKAALERQMLNLADHLQANPEVNLADAAYTLQVGRKAFAYRKSFVSAGRDAAIQELSRTASGYVHTDRTSTQKAVRFLFPGQGAHYPNMGRELYELEPYFRDEMDKVCAILSGFLGVDLLKILYPDGAFIESAAEQLNQTRITQPAIFAVEYCLARLWMRWGIRPEAMLGHSIGEYVAACLSGVFSLEDALRLVSLRGTLVQELSRGAMLAVPLDESAVRHYLNEDISLAVSSSPSATVLAGTFEAIEHTRRCLATDGVESRILRTSHAFHSHMMEPILERFAELLSSVAMNPPEIPFLSNVTGGWISSEEAQNPEYWVKQLRQTVKLGTNIKTLLKGYGGILLEVGPGRSLSTLVRANSEAETLSPTLVQSLRHEQEGSSDELNILKSLSTLWSHGAPVDWQSFHSLRRRRRIPLPTYPFERQSFWIEPRAAAVKAAPAQNAVDASAAVSENGQASLASKYDRPALDSEFIAPNTPTESAVSELWQNLLGISAVGIEDNFFELGGHSLVAVQIVSRLRSTLHVELSLERLFDNQTVRSLAAVIDTLKAAGAEAKPSASVPPRIQRAAIRRQNAAGKQQFPDAQPVVAESRR